MVQNVSVTAGNVSMTRNHDVYQFMLPFEEAFDRDKSIVFLESVPQSVPFIVVAFYILLVFLGQRVMKNREPFHLRSILFTWNAILAVVSLVLMARYSTQVAFTIRHFGFHHSVCGPWIQDISPVGHLWHLVFLLTKFVELFDTMFVILRKQKLFFLHYFHHSTVLLYVWLSCHEQSANARWFGMINICIHVIMYTYYSLKSMSFQMPRKLSMCITIAQLSQMVVGCYINYYVFRVKQLGMPCSVSDRNLMAGASMYVSYFCLFLWFFYKTYFCAHSPRMAKQKTSSERKQK